MLDRTGRLSSDALTLTAIILLMTLCFFILDPNHVYSFCFVEGKMWFEVSISFKNPTPVSAIVYELEKFSIVYNTKLHFLDSCTRTVTAHMNTPWTGEDILKHPTNHVEPKYSIHAWIVDALVEFKPTLTTQGEVLTPTRQYCSSIIDG